MKFISSKYPCQDCFSVQISFDGQQYICRICHSKVIQGKIPCQAVVNNMYVDDIPTELASLKKLEQILIAQRIVFEKIVVMPKGQQRKIKGAICNVPVQCDQTCKILPRPPERSAIILLKLKRKLQFRGHVYFESVRPEFVLKALNWLKFNNALYKDIEVDCTNIDIDLTNTGENACDNFVLCNSLTSGCKGYICGMSNCSKLQLREINNSESNHQSLNIEKTISSDSFTGKNDDKEVDDPLNEHRSPANETCLQSVIPDYPVTIIEENNCRNSTGREIYNIAPGENKHPVSLMTDQHSEELAFPVLFPKGNFGFTAERDLKLSPIKYFNARLLHYSGRFATNPEYLFFAVYHSTKKSV